MRDTLALLLLASLAACSNAQVSTTGGSGTTAGSTSSSSSTAASSSSTAASSSSASSSAASSSSSSTTAASSTSGTTSSSSSTASSSSAASSSTSASSSSSGSTGAGLCSGSFAFCDDYSSAVLAGYYATRNGTWTRSTGRYQVLDSNTWERARAVLAAADVSDFDVTIVGASMGDSGFGLVYDGSATSDDGFAVILHPAQFQGVYLKQLNPGQQDTNIASYALPSQSPGVAHTLRVVRSSTVITVWLDGAQVLQSSDSGVGAHGQLGLIESTTDQTANSGATFTLLRVDSWSLQVSGSSSGSTGTSSSTGSSGSSGSSGSTGANDAGWILTWADEFDGGDYVQADPNKWQNEVGGWGMGNQELEYYTAGTENVEQVGGNLVITARENTNASYTCTYPNGGQCLYTSGKLNSLGLFSQQYGRFEARIKVPTGQGMWPAFWMMGIDIGTVGWPACGEIDVMENIGKEPNNAYGSLHAPSFNTGSVYTLAVPYSDDFHVFAIEWEPQVIRFYVDDVLYETRTPADVPTYPDGGGGTWEFDREPFYLLLNLAVGGSWPGSPDSTTVFPQQMLVDYVRVYSR